jgi:branched-chain amino acid transport system permease protein
MNLFLQQLVEGIANGAIYGSLALALVFSFRSTNVVNFAQGEMATLSTYIAWQLLALGLPLAAAVSGSLILSGILGALTYLALVRLTAKAATLTVVSLLIGLYIAINSMMGYVWGHIIKPFPSMFPSGQWRLLGVAVSYETTGIVLVLGAVLLLLYLLLEKTRLGLGMRAAANAPENSSLVGIPVATMLMLGWAVASMLGALSGMLVAPKLFLNPHMMMGVIIYAFAAATLGGFDSILGAIVGGLVVGIAENLVATYVPFIGADLKIVVALALIFITLLVQPAGLFGRRRVQRV